MILHWEGQEGMEGERVLLVHTTKNGNTALHYAAANGWREGVDMILSFAKGRSWETFLTITTIVNSSQLTPCDLSDERGYESLSDHLEGEMLFGDKRDVSNAGFDPWTVSSNDDQNEDNHNHQQKEAEDDLHLLNDFGGNSLIDRYMYRFLVLSKKWNILMLIRSWWKWNGYNPPPLPPHHLSQPKRCDGSDSQRHSNLLGWFLFIFLVSYLFLCFYSFIVAIQDM